MQQLQLPKLRKVDPNTPKKKKILLLSDDLRLHSGIATMSREFVTGTAHWFDWVQVGAAINHPDKGKVFDISEAVNKERGITNANIKIYPNDGYGNEALVRELIYLEKPDAIIIFTDPRYWVWFFHMEHELRQQIPIIYYNIWDDVPYPFWNENFYESCDMLLNISKQTNNIVKNVVRKNPKPDWAIQYVPHGINEKQFFPIDETHPQWEEYQKTVFEVKIKNNVDFVVFWNNRNIRRKQPGDVILAYKSFCDKLTTEQASRVALFMHTQPVDGNGTDLLAVQRAICPDYKIIFSDKPVPPHAMNYYYNLADVTLNIASNEGFGLSGAESLMAGTPIINNVTGGLQDQCRFEDENGNWIEFDTEFSTNHTGKYKKHGIWAKPVFPSNRSLQGSPETPYIFDDRVSFTDVADAIKYWYDMSPDERHLAGLAGRNWVVSEESGMSSFEMCNRFKLNIENCFANWTPRKRFAVYKASKSTPIKNNGIVI